MPIFRFTVECDQYISQEMQNRLLAGGCEDAMEMDSDGHLIFERDSPTLAEALRSAIHDVEKVLTVKRCWLDRDEILSKIQPWEARP